MATILEGLNDIVEALGGSTVAEHNLEALNAISGALGGDTDAASNAEAIANIAQNASSGGGGTSDFSTAKVTVINDSNRTVNINGPFLRTDGGYNLIVISESVGRASTNDFDVLMRKQTVPLPVPSDYIGDIAISGKEIALTVTGNAAVDEFNISVWGDCTITVSDE